MASSLTDLKTSFSINMSKLFHEVALQPEAMLRTDALTLIRELRLDHSRYIQALPDDLYREIMEIIRTHPDPIQHKKLAMLEGIRASIVLTRARSPAVNFKAKSWREMISLESRNEPFDLMIGQMELISKSNSKDLDSYLLESENELGSVTKSFSNPDDWWQTIKPVLMSDNALAIIDRYFDPSKPYYSKLFSSLIGWLKKTRVSSIRIFVGPPTVNMTDTLMSRSHFEAICSGISEIFRAEHSDSKINVMVTYRSDLHLRYLGTKVCAIELDYGFRLSGNRAYRVSVMRTAGLKEFRTQFFVELSSPYILEHKVVWPC